MGLKKVASAEGARRYKLPIGSVIGKGGLGSRGVGGSLVGKRSNGRIKIGRTAKAHLDGIRESQKSDPKDLPEKDTGGVKHRSAARHLKNIKAGHSKGGREKNPYVSSSSNGEGADRDYTPLTNAEYKQHTANVERLVKENMHLATEKTHATKVVGPDGKERFVWSPERQKLHKQIVDRLWKEQNGDKVPNEGKGLVSGGLGGAGKSTVLDKHAGVDQSQYITANPDDVKEVLVELNALPDIEGLSKLEMAALMHEESSDVAMLLANRAYAERKNLTWDITMASPSSVAARLKQFKDNGYTEVDAVFVDIPVETSVQRALDRHTRGLEAHRQGKGHGGRYVPPAIIRKNVDPTGKFSSKNRATFESLKDQFTSWGIWDNSVKNRDPVKVDGTGRWATKGKK